MTEHILFWSFPSEADDRVTVGPSLPPKLPEGARVVATIPPGCGRATAIELKGDAVVVRTESGVDVLIPASRFCA